MRPPKSRRSGRPRVASWCAELTETPKKCQGNAKKTGVNIVNIMKMNVFLISLWL